MKGNGFRKNSEKSPQKTKKNGKRTEIDGKFLLAERVGDGLLGFTEFRRFVAQKKKRKKTKKNGMGYWV